METVTLNNLEQTTKLAEKLLELTGPNKFFLLSGDLGAGKTTFTKALLKLMQVNDPVTSPTFVLLNQYEVNGLFINHIDGYRLTKDDDIEMLVDEFDDAFNVIEWYENLGFDFEQTDYVKLSFTIINDHERQVKILKKGE